MASEVNAVDITARASTPGVNASTARSWKWIPTRCAPATPPTSTSTGITIARSSCSPLRTISRDSIDACASTWRRKGAAPGWGVNVPVSVMAQPASGDLEEDVLEVALAQVQGLGQDALLLAPPRDRRQRGAVGRAGDQEAGLADGGHVDLRSQRGLQGRGGAVGERLGDHESDRRRSSPS